MTNCLPNLLITGGNGQLAQALKQVNSTQFNLLSYSHETLDITNIATLKQTLGAIKPHCIINTAAYTQVDKAETEKEMAYKTNVEGVRDLGQLCHDLHIPLIHISTDYVFDGKKNCPYQEEDAVNPLNYYGESKWLGEEALRHACEKHLILRVSGIFSAVGNNFFKTMQKLAHKSDLKVVDDQLTCPTYAKDIATTLLHLAERPLHFGTFHYCSTPAVSWHQFAESILNRAIQPIALADYPCAAKRPLYSVLNCEKIATHYGIKQPSWQTALQELQ